MLPHLSEKKKSQSLKKDFNFLKFNTMKKSDQNEKTGLTSSANTPNLQRLYRLINAMNPAQKRDFRKYSRFWGEPSAAMKVSGDKGKSVPYYIQLFDAINRFVNDERDVEDLQKYLERHRLGNRATLSDRSDYLYDCILESLRTTPDHGRLFSQLNGLMQDINTLYHKGLGKDAQILVVQARKIALQLDKPTYLLELQWWENSLKPKETERTRMMAVNESTRLAEEQAIRHFHRMSELRNTYWLLAAEGRHIDMTLDSAPEYLRTLFEMEVKDSLQTFIGFRCKVYFLLAMRLYGDMASKIIPEQSQYWLEKTFDAGAMLIKAYRGEFALFAKEEPAGYWGLLENQITRCRQMGKQVQADELMEILEKEAPEYTLIYNRLNRFMAVLDVQGGLEYISKKRISSAFEQFKEQISESRQIIICYQCGLLYFLADKWSDAHRWFAKTLKGHRPDAHHIAVTLTHLLDIICIFELKSYKTPISRVFENFEARQQRAGQWSIFLENLTLLLKNYLTERRHEEVRSPLAALREEVLNNTLLGSYGIVLAWIEAQINHTDTLTELKKYA